MQFLEIRHLGTKYAELFASFHGADAMFRTEES
jgi:hypothetical protein